MVSFGLKVTWLVLCWIGMSLSLNIQFCVIAHQSWSYARNGDLLVRAVGIRAFSRIFLGSYDVPSRRYSTTRLFRNRYQIAFLRIETSLTWHAGIIYRMDPFLMPKSFCLTQLALVNFFAFVLAGVCAAFTYATTVSVLWPSQMDTSAYS